MSDPVGSGSSLLRIVIVSGITLVAAMVVLGAVVMYVYQTTEPIIIPEGAVLAVDEEPGQGAEPARQRRAPQQKNSERSTRPKNQPATKASADDPD